MRTTLLLTSLLLAGASSAATRPSNAALRKAFEQNVGTVVQVSGGRSSGMGVIVGADGQIVTSVEHVGLYEAKVTFGGRDYAAQVLSADARLKIAVLQIPTSGAPLQAPAVHTRARLEKGTWLVGIRRKGMKDPALLPLAGQIVAGRTLKTPFFVTDLALAPGSPLFDSKGRLVAVVVSRVGRIGSRALPVGAIAAKLAQGTVP